MFVKRRILKKKLAWSELFKGNNENSSSIRACYDSTFYPNSFPWKITMPLPRKWLDIIFILCISYYAYLWEFGYWTMNVLESFMNVFWKYVILIKYLIYTKFVDLGYPWRFGLLDWMLLRGQHLSCQSDFFHVNKSRIKKKS